jgi:hypothetical protein
MKKIILFILPMLMISYFFSTSIFPEGAGVTSENFTKIPEGARQCGMGEAFTGIADDVNAVYWNPAGLTQLTQNNFCLMHTAWLLSVNDEYGAYALPIPGIGTVELSGIYLYGSVAVTSEDSKGDYVATNAQANASDMDIDLAFAKKLSDFIGDNSVLSDLSLGVSASILNDQIYTDQGGGFAASLDAYYRPKYENYSLGVSVQNMGVATNRPDLPLTIRFGIGYRFALENIMLPFTDEGYFKLLDNNAAADIDVIYYPEEELARMNVGVEKYWILNKYHTVALRGGYKFGYDLGGLNGFTGGVGYKLTAIKDMSFDIDYSLTPYGDLGVAQRISVSGMMFGIFQDHQQEDITLAKQYYKQGYTFLTERKYAEAMDQFKECLKRNRNYSSAYIGIGACFLNTGKNDLAMEAYNKALECDPANEQLKNFIERVKSGADLGPQQGQQQLQQQAPATEQQQQQQAPANGQQQQQQAPANGQQQ